MEPKLYLCPTPIGNLEDITYRTARVLAEAGCVYCEDTRRTAQLMNRLKLKKPLFSCHEHNERQRSEEIEAKVKGGEPVAYVSDAGMPGISDPGERMVTHCIQTGTPFEVLPGPSASLTALVLSGLPTAEACFVGFLPRKGKERKETLQRLSRHRGTLIVYENPLRVANTAKELMEVWGDRKAVLVRELTKVYEQAVRSTLTGLAQAYEETPPRGECVLLVAGAQEAKSGEQDLDGMLLRLLEEGKSAKDAAKEAGELLGMPRNEAYRRALLLKG